MKVIDQGYEIFPEQTTLSEQIERCGRTAYESLDKIKPGSAEPFVKGMIGKGHWPVLDMGAVHVMLEVNQQAINAIKSYNFDESDPAKYVFFDVVGEARKNYLSLLVSGSPRALTAYCNSFPLSNFIIEIGSFLQDIDPTCFSGIRLHTKVRHVDIHEVTEDILDHTYQQGAISTEVYMRHKHVGASFTTSLNMSHQLVRHRPCGFLQRSGRYVREDGDISFIKQALIKNDLDVYGVWVRHLVDCEEKYFELLDAGLPPQAARTVLPGATMTVLNIFTNLAEWEHIGRLRTKKGADPQQRALMIPFFKELTEAYPMLDITSKPYTREGA